jgi:hypothetical protein
LCGCAEAQLQQQAKLDAIAASRDHAWCESIGIGRRDARYANCRALAKSLRNEELTAESARKAAEAAQDSVLLGAGAALLSQSRPYTLP